MIYLKMNQVVYEQLELYLGKNLFIFVYLASKSKLSSSLGLIIE